MSLVSIALTTLLACRTPAPEPSVPAEPPVPVQESDPGPLTMSGLPIPVHPDFSLGELGPKADVAAFQPAPATGGWRIEHLYASQAGGPWTPIDAVVQHDRTGLPTVERHKLKAMGQRMVSEIAHRLEHTSAGWAVVSSRAPSGEFVELASPELYLAPDGTVFQSPWVGQQVTVEVMGTQQVTVPAGSFRALRVRRAWARGASSTTEDSWWATEIGLVARVFQVKRDAATQTRLTLLAEHGNTSNIDELVPRWEAARRAMETP